ncbi:MAG: hypothetical protein HZB26_19230 [Candidatus Hydrogenedentes bacterium]|nr:hypothetical protein [Candidatus Hydrogenedentota bacterium]
MPNQTTFFVALIGGALLCTGTAMAAEPIELVPGHKQLFLDDYAVREVAGLNRVMHTPEKRGAVLKPDIPSDGNLIQIRSAPMWIPGENIYKLLYLAYGLDEKNQTGPALAVSKDGLHWEKPSLGQMSVHGSKDNNRIVIDFPPPNNGLENVVYDAGDPDPARRYKGLAGAIGRAPVVSADCIHWTKLDAPAIPSSDEAQLVYDQDKRRFMATLKTSNEYGRAFNIATSEDFAHWTPNRFLYGADAEDQPLAREFIRKRLADPALAKPVFVEPDPDTGWKRPEGYQPTWRAECYNIAVFPYEGVYIGLPQMYYPTGTELPSRANTDGFHLIQLAMTRDLVTWTRLGNRQPFIGPSPKEEGRRGVYDRMQLCVTNRPIEHGDELWFYYSGLKWRSLPNEVNADGTPRDPATLGDEERAEIADGWGAACLAVLRRDGFISLDAEADGYVVTNPLKMNGNLLFLNLTASQGSASVEVLDEKGSPVPGFTREDALPAQGDAVRLPVRWKADASVSALAGRLVSLKIYLSRASLYAFWTE